MNRHLHDEEGLEPPERVPSLLTARELQAKDPARKEKDPDPRAGERHASASFTDDNGEPTVSDENPPRGKRGLTKRK